jgi:hypothetical protein
MKEMTLRDYYDYREDCEIISEDILSNSRWSYRKRDTIKDGGKFYFVFYSVGATEYQETDFEQGVEFFEVIPVEKTIVVYEKREN